MVIASWSDVILAVFYSRDLVILIGLLQFDSRIFFSNFRSKNWKKRQKFSGVQKRIFFGFVCPMSVVSFSSVGLDGPPSRGSSGFRCRPLLSSPSTHSLAENKRNKKGSQKTHTRTLDALKIGVLDVHFHCWFTVWSNPLAPSSKTPQPTQVLKINMIHII